MGGRRWEYSLIILALASGLYLFQRTIFPAWMIDSFPNQLGAWFWKNSEPQMVYASIEEIRSWEERALPVARELGLEGDVAPFMYPPFVAALFSPVSSLSPRIWRNVIFGINLLLLPLLASQLLRVIRVQVDFRSLSWMFALLLWCYPLARAVKLGQIVPLLALLTWVALLQWRSGKDLRGGVLLGIVGALKVFPLLLLVLPVLERRWRAIIAVVSTVVVVYSVSMLAMGWAIHANWLRTMRQFGSLAIPFFGNQSLSGWYMRFVHDFSFLHSPPVSAPEWPLLRFGLPLLFGGTSLVAVWRLRGSLLNGHLPVAAGLLFGAFCLAAPNAWEHYYLFVLPVLAWALWLHGRTDSHLSSRIWLWGSAFFFLMKLTRFNLPDDGFAHLVSGSHAFGMLLLWIWLFRYALQSVTRRQLAGHPRMTHEAAL